jgi:hypothetical protein
MQDGGWDTLPNHSFINASLAREKEAGQYDRVFLGFVEAVSHAQNWLRPVKW